MVINGKSVNLRVAEQKDLAGILKYLTNPKTLGPYSIATSPSPAQFLERFNATGFWREEHGTLLVVNKDDSRLIGQVGYRKSFDMPETLSINYMTYKDSDRRHGYALEATKLLVKYLWESRKTLNRLQLRCHKNNIGSIKIALHCGFKFEATLFGALRHNGKYQNLEQFYLLR